jgi:hypothetical protein
MTSAQTIIVPMASAPWGRGEGEVATGEGRPLRRGAAKQWRSAWGERARDRKYHKDDEKD